ncbi:MAG: glycosyltransferase family 39 protein [Candidatus Woesebacteria bacterium]|nr:glycosyltransferase family 39 protein [Candidatus Woesebacteria bacterium]
MNKLQKIILIIIVSVAFVLRFYQLDRVPPGLHADEASQGFNAFSILKTGKDMYGKSFPILFRANGSYQPPMYTYLTAVPTIILGNGIFTVKIVSALSGVGLVFLTYFLISRLFIKSKKEAVTLGLFTAGVVAISPWAIHFSRLAVEANLGVLIFVAGVYILAVSLRKISLFPLACLILGISTHAYYSERVIAVLLLAFVVIVYRKILLKTKKTVILGLSIFALTLLPHLYLLSTGALTKRLSQVSYLGTVSQEKIGFVGKSLEIGKQFVNHYLIYVSPKNLFFDPGSSLGRTTPDLGVYYPWMLAPFLIGLGYLFKKRHTDSAKIIWILLLIAPIPAALTGDLFYPLRTLDYLWVIAVVISLGSWQIFEKMKNKWVKLFTVLGLVGYSLVVFGISYFVIFKYELAIGSGEPYVKLMPVLDRFKDRKIIVDFNSRAWGVGIRMTYLKAVDPKLVQANLKSQLKTNYYDQEVNAQEIFVIDNITFEKLDWNKVCGPELIIVGDELTFSPEQILEHKLTEEFTVPDYLGKPILFGYSTKRVCK